MNSWTSFAFYLVMLRLVFCGNQNDDVDLRGHRARRRDFAADPMVNGYLPQQIHIAFGNSVSTIVIMWATVNEDESFVEYWSNNDINVAKKQVKGESVMFSRNSKGCKHLHRAELFDLPLDTLFYYTVGGKLQNHRSEQLSFSTPSIYKPHTYMVYGDLGTQSATLQFLVHEAIASPSKVNYTTAFHVGDIAYDLGRNGGQIGDLFLNQIQKMASQIPYMTVPGDHDLFVDEQYRYRFSNPNADWPMQMNQLWYSFNLGKTHFVCFSSEVFFSNEENVDTLIRWLNNDLKIANENRSHFPWIIVMTHRPAYCSMVDKREDCTKENSVVRKKLERIYVQYGVDVVFSGHEHLYERTWPVKYGRAASFSYINPIAPVHIIIGTFGNQYLTESVSSNANGWSAFRKSESVLEMYGRLTIYNYTHLYWEALSAADNSRVDRMLIVQKVHGSFDEGQIKVNIPNPLGKAGEKWKENEENDSLINFNFFLDVGPDDYNTRVTVLFFTSIILLIGLIFRKRILNFLKFWCVKNEKCNNTLQ